MTQTAPECPTCSAEMRLTSGLSGAGLSRSWVCTDTTCPTVVPEEEAQRLVTRDDLLGAPIVDLMSAPVTTTGGGGGGKGRRTEKPGEKEARLRVRRSSVEWDGTLGQPDRDEEALGCDRVTSRIVTLRLSAEDYQQLERLKEVYSSAAEVYRRALSMLVAVEAAKEARARKCD